MRIAALLVSIGVLAVAACGDNLQGNRPPDVADQNVTTPEDTPVSITVAVEDPDDDDELSFDFSQPQNGTITQTGGIINYRPDDDFHGTDSITVTVSDGEHEVTAVINIRVTPVNDDPVANADAIAGNEDVATVIEASTLLANDDDVDGDTLTVTAVGTASTGSVALVGTTITYTPPANFTGDATFEYAISDGTATDTAVVTVSVGGANDPPLAVDDTTMTPEDMAIMIPGATLTANDTDAEGQALAVTAVSAPMNGTVTLTAGTVTFTPAMNFNGTAGFDYTVSDGAATDVGHVTVAVTPVNDPPVAMGTAVMTNEDTPVTITLTATDVDNAAVTFAVAMAPTAGTLGPITQATPTSATVVYTPAANSTADDTFTFTASDGTATSAPATVTIDVVPQNDPPVATAGMVMTNEDTPVTITLAGTDPDGNPLTFAIATGPTAGTLGTIMQATPTTATVVYTPANNSTADDSFTFRVNDGTVNSAPATVTIDVVPQNDAPVAIMGMAQTNEDSPVSITLAGSDADGDALVFAIVDAPTAGTLGPIVQATPTTATVTYTPANNSTADDSFTFRVNDGISNSAPAAVTIDVVPQNDPPVAVDDTDSVERDTTLVRAASAYTANDTDVDAGAVLTITAVGNAVNGTVSLSGGNVSFTPSAGYVGPASFEYTVSDGAATDVGRVDVTVILTNTPVVAVDDNDNTAEDQPMVRQTSVYLANDVDPDPQTLTITAVGNAVNGTVGLVGTTITFTPAAEYSGPASFEYTVSDGFDTDVGRVNVTVTPVNDPPVAVDDATTTPEDQPVLVAVLANDTNDDGPVTIQSFTQGANGVVTQVGNDLRYAPNLNFNGGDSFSYTIVDGGGLTDTAIVNVTVTPTNDRPVAMDQNVTMPENAPRTITLNGSDIDVPAQSLTFAIAEGPDFGTLGPVTPASPTSATVVYTPNPNYVGVDNFSFTVSDGALTSDPGLVLLQITNVVVCGDGQIEAPETCDDNDAVGGDGCSAACQTESGWTCVGQPSACDPICGDTIVIAGEEECDDGNGIETDGCTTQCQSGVVCGTGSPALATADRFAVDPGTGHCYVSFDDEQTTFAAAQTACVAAGGHLAAITSGTEQAFVAMVHNTTQNPWIGLTDELVEGSFGWITGEAFSFNNFAPAQPDGGDPEDCVNVNAGTGQWNDTSCTFIGFTAGRICEIEPPVCGNGRVEGTEACDDGNTSSSDGCSATCTVEAGAVCTGTQPTTCGKLVINEIDYDQPGTDNSGGQFEFVEIRNNGTAAANVTDIALVLINNSASPGTEYFFDGTSGMTNIAKRIRLNTAAVPGNLLAPGGMIVVGPMGLTDPLPASVFRITVVPAAAGMLQNGGSGMSPSADSVMLFNVATNLMVDTLLYEGTTASGVILSAGTFPVNEGNGHLAGETAVTAGPNESLQRFPNGRDLGDNATDFSVRLSTPGATN